MPIHFDFDFKKPDYTEVFRRRHEKLTKLRNDPKMLSALKLFYRDNPAQCIIDWGVTIEPRNPEIGLPAMVPFLLVPKQEEWCHWLMERWKNREPGVTEKSRDMGISWLMVGMSAVLCLFNESIIIGYGNRKREYVDELGSPKSFFQRLREFMLHLPKEFTGGWDVRKHAPFARMLFPETKSVITGEMGDNIGRGDRASIYFLDESAFLEHPELIDASLSHTTNCRIDVSTPNGTTNPFYRKRSGGKVSVFTFHWRDNPLKDEEWYKKKCDELDDPVVIAQELDLDYTSSVEGILIPTTWVQASIDAHIKLGIKISGDRRAGFDVADAGVDKNAICGRNGILVEHLEEWSGKGSDIFKSVEKALIFCDMCGYNQIYYDADGLGASVRGDARVVNAARKTKVEFVAFRGSGEVYEPEGDPFTGERFARRDASRTNADFFANAKAQSWWRLRKRFYDTYQAVVNGKSFIADNLISISSSVPNLSRFLIELSQPTYSTNGVGKVLIDKTPNGARSPNLADAAMIAFAPQRRKGYFDVGQTT